MFEEDERLTFPLIPGGDLVSITILKGQKQKGAFRFTLYDQDWNVVRELEKDEGKEDRITRQMPDDVASLRNTLLKIDGAFISAGEADGQSYAATLTVSQGDRTKSVSQAGKFNQAKSILFLVTFE